MHGSRQIWVRSVPAATERPIRDGTMERSRPMEIRVRPHAITAVTFPADDAVFGERVRELLEGPLLELRDEDDLVDELIEHLHVVFPMAAARFRDELGGFGDRPLYVFRDGTIRSTLDGDAWIRDSHTARVITDAQGRYVDANEPAEALFGVSREVILSSEAGAFT